jgi:nanoRNase/pAp phosphatase (c-di-AMP/oligoRNAs hydrolase)
MWTPIIKALTENQRFIITSHLNPDCDALGSELALAYHLTNLGKDVAILNADPVIPDYQFLDLDCLIKHFSAEQHTPLISQAEVIVVLDTSGGWDRLGRVGEICSHFQIISICIDHHPHNQPFTDMAVIDTNVIATGELIFDLITAMQGQITALMAQALYAAILTDSGSFRFPKTSPRTHRIVAKLLEYGANPSKIYHLLYEQQPLSKVHLKGYVLQNIKLATNGQIAYVGLDAETMARYNINPLDLNTFSNLAQQIAGVRIAIFAIELPDGRIKLSLRSDGTIPVNRLAAEYGGGGHAPAAGAITEGPLQTVINQVVEKASQLISG